MKLQTIDIINAIQEVITPVYVYAINYESLQTLAEFCEYDGAKIEEAVTTIRNWILAYNNHAVSNSQALTDLDNYTIPKRCFNTFYEFFEPALQTIYNQTAEENREFIESMNQDSPSEFLADVQECVSQLFADVGDEEDE